ASTVGEDAPPSAIDVLGNDVDPDGGPISITGVTQPTNGVVAVTGGGTGLTYAPAADFCTDPPGTSTDDFTYTLSPGGSSATVRMTVTCVNDPPSISASGTIATYVEGDAPVVLDSAIGLSDVDDTDLQSATLVLTARPDGDSVEALAADTSGTSILAAYTPSTGTLSLTGVDTVASYQQVLRSVTYVNGSTDPSSDGVGGTSDRTITCVVSDGAASSAVAFLGVDVMAMNAPPQVTSPIAYSAVGNTLLRVADPVGDGHDTVLPGRIASVIDTSNAFAKAAPTDSDSPPGQLGFVAGTYATGSGGSLTIDDDGDFFYLPPVGFEGLDTVSIDVADGDGAATPVSFEITVAGMVWYVEDTIDPSHNPPGGDGRSTDAFETLAAAEAASGPGHTLLLFETDAPLDESITLQDGQKLYGQRVEEEPVSLLPAGLFLEELADTNARPQIHPASGAAVTVDASAASLDGIEIRHLDLGSGDAEAIRVTTAGTSVVTGLICSENVVSNAALEGISLQTSHTAGDASITLDSNEIRATGDAIRILHTGPGRLLAAFSDTVVAESATGDGFDIRSSSGPLVVTTFSGTAISGDVQGAGAFFQRVLFDADPSTSSYETVSAGNTTIGAPGDGVGGTALGLEMVSGDLAFTDLDAEGTAGLIVTGTGEVDLLSGTGFRLATASGSMVVATAGPAVDADPATLGLIFDSVRSTASPSSGVRLVDVAGSFQAGVGSEILSSAGSAFAIASSLGSPLSITYSGSITNTSGRLIDIDGYPAGGTALFDGLVLSDSGGQGIRLSDVRGDVTLTATSTTIDNSSAAGVSIVGDSDGMIFLDDVTITSPAGAGIEILDPADRIAATIDFDNVDVAQATNGARLLEIQGLGDGSVSFDGASALMATDGTGVLIASNAGSSSVTLAAGATLALGTSGSRLSDATAFTMNGNSTGTMVDIARLDAFTTSRTAVAASGMGRLALGSSTLDANQAVVLDLDGVAVAAQLGTVRSASSPGHGIEITNMPATTAITVTGSTTIDDP
ncbi:MAG: cadherin-like domain-containing protein, partial [Holophagales bacterium]|nr:cadherin-like domain-containing protein [Holophagales bacterium]